jgi:pyrroloquinoline quinone biosynthesis protein D
MWLRDQLLRDVLGCSARKLSLRERVLLGAASLPQLPRGVRLRHDPVRGLTLLLAPERVLYPDSTGVAILRECNGDSTIAQIATRLAERFEAPVAEIQHDTIDLLQDLADRGYVVLG